MYKLKYYQNSNKKLLEAIGITESETIHKLSKPLSKNISQITKLDNIIELAIEDNLGDSIIAAATKSLHYRAYTKKYLM